MYYHDDSAEDSACFFNVRNAGRRFSPPRIQDRHGRRAEIGVVYVLMLFRSVLSSGLTDDSENRIMIP